MINPILNEIIKITAIKKAIKDFISQVNTKLKGSN